MLSERHFAAMRTAMLQEISAGARLVSESTGKDALGARVMEAMAAVPRHGFVPVELEPYAYLNRPLPIGCDKTISQPFIVALMTDLLQVGPGDRILEIGTGLGYQAAVLARLAARVYSVEAIEELASGAAKRLKRCGCRNVEIKTGNGYYGWPEHAPFDGIMVTAAPELAPPPLIQQLKPGGRMVIPTGLPDSQQLVVMHKDANGRVTTREILAVRFSQLEHADAEREARA